MRKPFVATFFSRQDNRWLWVCVRYRRNIFMIRVVCLFLWCAPIFSQAQFTYTLDQSIPVQDLDGADLPLAWAGGLNAAQFNTMDLNGDGQEDLVLFDRMANKVITFIASDNQYIAAPQYEDLFPKEVYSWLLLRDYNCDGKKDIFTGHTLGIKVFRNISSGENLAWEQHLFSTGFPPESNVLMTEGSTTHVNLQLQPDDLPSISDVDGDGDLDIFNVQYMGSAVEFHQNLSVENNQPCGSLQFKRVTRSWGGFRECGCGEFAFSNEACPPHTGGRTKHAGGKSLLAIDMNGDHQQDLLFSEAECTRLFLLPNSGTNSNPLIQDFSAFPRNNPLNLVMFPAPFYEDVDFDGKKDIIVVPNIFAKEFLNTNLQQSTWLYRNTGTAANPDFTFVQRNFLQGGMVDVGDNAVPAFTDFDGDGDFDMLLSSHSSEEYTSKLFLYENTGSASSPSFKLVSDDFLGFSTSRLFNLKIQIVDIDNNQTLDLVFTATSFDSNATNLYYLANKSQTSLDFSGQSIRMLDFSITRSENVYVFDVGGDGLPDILVGRSEGNLEFWKNTGIAGSPLFTLEQGSFLGFGTSPLRQNLTVAIADLDGDGASDLVIGDHNGKPGIISDFRNGTSADVTTKFVYNEVLETYAEKNMGGKIWPVVVNLFNSNRPALAIGNGLGGVHILKNDEGAALPEQPQVFLYPNPVDRTEELTIRPDRHGMMQIISVLGQQLSEPVMLRANEVYRYSLPPLAAGLYLLTFTAGKRSHTQRLVVK